MFVSARQGEWLDTTDAFFSVGLLLVAFSTLGQTFVLSLFGRWSGSPPCSPVWSC